MRLFGCFFVIAIHVCDGLPAQESAVERVAASQQFHLRAIERTGLLIPLYLYPADIHTNAAFNRVMELKRQFPAVPFWFIANPASGPGDAVDANYTKAIDRLIGSGCVVIGYLPTDYGRRTSEQVQKHLLAWKTMYPRVHGIFFDEMIYEDTEVAVAHQVKLNALAREGGFWPTVANPGTSTPGRYFAAEAADVIVIHESSQLPQEETLHGNYFGGNSDFAPHSRAVLLYGRPNPELDAIRMISRHARWVYITHDTYTPNDPAHSNPWDELSVHLEAVCRVLAE